MSHTLLLNADAQPLSLLPISTIDWQESIRYLVLDKVRVLAWYDNWIVRSARWETKVPAVIMLREYHKKRPYIRLAKRNVFLRDQWKCGYCGTHVDSKNATLDHVVPLSKGGKSSWDNLVTACKACNYLKADKVGIKPKIKLHRPDYYELAEKRRLMGFDIQHPSWADYLPNMS